MSATNGWEAEYIDWKAGRRPDLAREHFLRGGKGAALGGPTLETRLARLAELDAVWDAAESKSAENVAAVARTLCRIAASALRRPAPDALAVYGAQSGPQGRQDALLVLRAAGYDPDPVAQRWADQAPLRQQASSTAGNLYEADPAHDPRVLAAVRKGRDMAELAGISAQVGAERRREKEERLAAAVEAGHDPTVLWTTRDGKVVRDGGAVTPHVPQRSVVRRGVPELGSEDVPPLPPFTWGAGA